MPAPDDCVPAMPTSARDQRALEISKLPLASVSEKQGFFSGTRASIADVWAHRELLGLLVRREIKARYKDSSLGVIWSLVRPLAQLLIYYFAIGEILGVARNVPSFAIFVFVGLTMWGLFTEIVSSGTSSIVNNAGLVKKVYLPREIFPLGSVGGALFNFAIQFGILLVATLVAQQFPLGTDLLYAPLAFLVILVYGTALALFLSAVNVYLRDIQHVVEVALIILFWASPIVYSFTFVHDLLGNSALEQLYLSNPITLAVLGMQKAIWVAGSTVEPLAYWPPDLAIRMSVALVIGIVLAWLAQRVFARLQGNFAQEL
ncbi:ABC transporter permease [Agromyces soli]